MREWRIIQGHENYRISNLGELYRLDASDNHWIPAKVYLDEGGYPRVDIWKNGIRRKFRLHTLVMACFVGPRPENLIVRHLDGNPTNNRLDNLCYGTHVENQEDSRQHGTKKSGEDHVQAKLSQTQADEIRARYAEGGISQQKLAELYGVSQMIVSRIVRGIKYA